MARIAGVNLPLNKRIEIGLTYVHGVGRSTANELLEKAKIDAQTKLQVEGMKHQESAAEDALNMALQKLDEQHEASQAALDRKLEIFLAQFKAAHETALAAAQGRSVEMSQDRGQEKGQERESESSRGQSRLLRRFGSVSLREAAPPAPVGRFHGLGRTRRIRRGVRCRG